MPLYDFEGACRHKFTLFRKIAERDAPARCPHCGETQVERRISAPRIAPDYAGYTCPITGDWVEGRKAHQENLRKHGCRLKEPGEFEEAQRRRAQSEAELEARIDATIEAEIHAMPAEKREALASDLKHCTTELVRT